MGKRIGVVPHKLNITDDIAKRVVRLPFYMMNDDEIDYLKITFIEFLNPYTDCLEIKKII